MPRIFVSLPLSSVAAAALGAVVPDAPALRRVSPDLLHVTLAFIGQIPEERVGEVIAVCEAVAATAEAFEIGIDRLGTFPEGGPARVLWAGTGAAAGPIARLGAAVRAELERGGIPFDPKPIRPHITLGRVRESATAEEAAAIARAAREVAPPGLSSPADAIHVVESALSPKGPRHSSRARIPLA